jgi:uncharacterized protein YegJ (DUF2314 family)
MPVTMLSGEAKHAEFPNTFYLPSLEERSNVPVGDFARIIFTDGDVTERMWVKVTKQFDDGSYLGELANDPAFLKLKHLDPVSFQAKYVIDIMAH